MNQVQSQSVKPVWKAKIVKIGQWQKGAQVGWKFDCSNAPPDYSPPRETICGWTADELLQIQKAKRRNA